MGRPYAGQGIGDGHISIMPEAYNTVDAGSWSFAGSTVRCYGDFRCTDVINSQLGYKMYLEAGTYTFMILGIKATNSGKAHLLIDTVDEGQIDQYNGSTVNNQRQTITGISISNSGLKDLAVKAASKNAASSGYILRLQWMAIWRTV